VTGSTGPHGEFTVSSNLAAPPDVVWRHAVSPAGVNRELRPLLRMTFPADVGDLAASWRPGQRVFRSWLLLGGVVPVEYDDVVFEEIDPGRRFLERSSMLTQRVWEHERCIVPRAGGCTLTDRIRFVPRIPWLGGLQRAIFRTVFALRHRNLHHLFGRIPEGGPG